MSSANSTKDHDKIKSWIEKHDGKPAIVKGTEDDGDGAGLLRVKFSNDDDLEEVEWQEFFSTFDESDLSFLYQDDKDSRFFKFVKGH
ncbi:hypothetical protein CA267_007285 [Alteromonas pelagimontana]|uniref:1,4-alpha-glucan branching enzyme n=1 Tax=Alteromonas pelagimontana TaxID=1858656 RepID=A0A6M4MBL6_9ALTE|nr:hypothetical protein [Alteromonas pelagimontana]QJR80592.1 hypothetical protein CA267_007285 [Alteromonas pelagimontana]